MNELRKEIFRLKIDDFSLRPIRGFTVGKEYVIIEEMVDRTGSNKKGMLYTVTDDDGNLRHINSNYFECPEPVLDMPPGTFPICSITSRGKSTNVQMIDDLVYENLVNIDLPVVRTKETDSNDLGFAKVTTLEDKVQKLVPKEPMLEMKILSGLRETNDYKSKNSFEIMQEALKGLEIQITSLQKIKEKMSLELEMLKRVSVLS